ncbi:2-oxo acid dehydrogenase subunit E2 [Tropicibacter sp. S64]|uniref:2-oxo acid dehydrogenase subunit E2 n=1 Tax=Tropicibacter sp. S64 TaxID=3415122 RepID=UPI003C7C67DE
MPSSRAGKIVDLLVSQGDRVREGTLLARVQAADSKASEPATPKDKPIEAAVPPPQPAPLTTPAAEPAKPVTPPPASGKSHASPSIRHYARMLGVPLTEVTGTGPKSRILRADVEAFVKARLSDTAPRQTASPGMGLPDWPTEDYEKFGPVERRKLSRIARISGPALTRNALVIPHVCNFDKADVTDLEDFRKLLNKEAGPEDARITLLAFAVKAVVAALKAYPTFNSSLDGDEIVLKRYWNIGVAADTPEGLVVPVVKEADRKSVAEIAAEMGTLAAQARAGKLRPAAMSGATFTISSLGGIGGTGFTPIINAPQVAILGMTRAEIRPVWREDTVQPRLIQPVSLSWDHRVVDGVAAARFLQHVCRSLTDFRRVSI